MKTVDKRQRDHEKLAPIIDAFISTPQGDDTPREWLHRVLRRVSFMRDPSSGFDAPSAVQMGRNLTNDCKERDGRLDERSVRETITRLVSALYRAQGRYPPDVDSGAKG